VPEGELSDPLFALGVGGEVIVRRRTKGLFLRDAPLVAEPHLFVATVTGVGALREPAADTRGTSQVREWTPVPVITLQGAARSVELGYADELVDLAQEFDWLTYVPTVSRPWEIPTGAESWDGLRTSCANTPTPRACAPGTAGSSCAVIPG